MHESDFRHGAARDPWGVKAGRKVATGFPAPASRGINASATWARIAQRARSEIIASRSTSRLACPRVCEAESSSFRTRRKRRRYGPRRRRPKLIEQRRKQRLPRHRAPRREAYDIAGAFQSVSAPLAVGLPGLSSTLLPPWHSTASTAIAWRACSSILGDRRADACQSRSLALALAVKSGSKVCGPSRCFNFKRHGDDVV